MVRLATADNEGFVVSRVDLDRDGPCYSVDTIGLLQDTWGAGVQVHFLIGVDLPALERQLPGAASLIQTLDTPTLNISSTEIRRRVRDGVSIRYLVPAAIEQYIGEYRLYR